MEQQNRTQKDTTRWSGRKKRAIAAVAVAALALVVLPVFAWLYMQRSMETITKVNMPYALLIGAGDAKPIQQLQLSNIDVSASKSKDVVFCVYSEKPSKYDLQLAHTTNIGFNYEIYTATLADSNASTDVVECLGKKYKKGALLPGSYLNIDKKNRYATDEYHKETYGNYTKSYVQQSAEPLYWKTSSPVKLPDNVNAVSYTHLTLPTT